MLVPLKGGGGLIIAEAVCVGFDNEEEMKVFKGSVVEDTVVDVSGLVSIVLEGLEGRRRGGRRVGDIAGCGVSVAVGVRHG